MDQRNGIQVSPESKSNKIEQRQSFQEQLDIHTQRYECEHRPYTLHKNYFQKVIDLSVRCKTVKLLDYNIGENREDLEYRNDFLHITQRHDPQKKLISWLHYNYKLLLCERQC